MSVMAAALKRAGVVNDTYIETFRARREEAQRQHRSIVHRRSDARDDRDRLLSKLARAGAEAAEAQAKAAVLGARSDKARAYWADVLKAHVRRLAKLEYQVLCAAERWTILDLTLRAIEREWGGIP